MKRTSLYETHLAAGATMVPFAGWEMPVSYAGTVAEVVAVRSSTGLFDVSHMGEVTVSGTGAFEFIQAMTTNDAAKLSPGKAQYSLLLNEGGGVVDDIIVYCLASDAFLIVLNAGCKDKDWDWLQSQVQGKANVVLEDVSKSTALIAVQGPKAVELISHLTGHENLSELKRFQFSRGQSGLIYSRTGYTGDDGFEIFCESADAPSLWNKLIDAGGVPAGLGARDVLRLEAGYPLFGHELDAQASPFESGVGWAVKMTKGNFIGRAALMDLPKTRSLVGLQMDERAIPREHYPISANGELIGHTTSGTWSPTIKAGIAMARVEAEFAVSGTPISVDIRGRACSAKVVALPFYRNGV